MIALLGDGGQGEVYRARDETLARDVAIKLLPAGVDEERAEHQFRREALLLARLQHPGIAVVHQFGRDQGRSYIVMELLEGGTLDQRLREGPLPPDEVARLGRELAEALAAAHARGVVHRDLKPANLALTFDGHLKVLDFGLSRLLAPTDDSALARTAIEPGSVAGTVPYMAPEQLRGEPADERTDVWAAGAVLYELATGRKPFPHTQPAQLMHAIVDLPVTPPHALVPAVPAGLDRVIVRCLEKDPARRWPDARSLGAALVAASNAARPRPIARRWLRVGAAAVTILIALGLAWWLRSMRPAGPLAQSLAVLPLTNLSADADVAFARGMTDELITTLGQIGALRVIAYTSVADYDPRRTPLRRFARDLGVGSVVTGTVFRSGDAVRISAQLVSPGNGRVLWSQSYERPLRDVLSLQNEVSRAIADRVRAQLSPPEKSRLSRIHHVDPVAYQAYLRGRAAWDASDSAGFVESVGWFQRAIAADPAYAPAHAGLADAYWGLAGWAVDPNAIMPAALAAARRAVALDDGLPEAHVALATAEMDYGLDWAAAEREFRRALALNPNHAAAHRQYAWLLRYLGRWREDSAQVQRSIELDPLSVFSQGQAGWPLFFARRYREAADQFQHTLALHPDQFVVHQGLGLCLEQMGENARAVAELQQAAALFAGTENRAFVAHALATAGRKNEARALVASLERTPRSVYVSPCDLAIPYVALGDRRRALDLIERALRERAAWVQFVGVDPRFDPLRNEPRFQAVVSALRSGAAALGAVQGAS